MTKTLSHVHTGGAEIRATGFSWRHASRKKPTFEDVTFTIEAGEKVLLLGPSGAGKSTMLAAIAGVLGSADEGDFTGSLTVGGEDPRNKKGLVGLVLQDPDSQVISARVGDDVVFGCENLLVDRNEMWDRARVALDMVGLDVSLDHPTEKLSGGQQQRLALAGVIAMGARVILLDEPTANLDPVGVKEVREAVASVVEKTKATLIIVEHHVDVWDDIVDRAIVLGDRHEGVIADGPIRDVIDEHKTMLLREGVWLPGCKLDLPKPRPVTAGPDVSAYCDVWANDLVVGWEDGVPVGPPRTIGLPAGASTVIRGVNGAGKSTTALTLAGLLAPLSGTVHMSESVAHGLGSNPRDYTSKQLAARVGYVFQDPEHQFVARTVREELEVTPRVIGGHKRRLIDRLLGRSYTGSLDAAIEKRVDELLERLRLDHLAQANPFTLSGGQKRRLSVASVLVTSPKVVYFDEPTFGQDRRTFIEMVALLRELADSGVTICSITHDELFTKALADHEVVLTP